MANLFEFGGEKPLFSEEIKMPTFYNFFLKVASWSQIFEKELVAFDLLLFPEKINRNKLCGYLATQRKSSETVLRD